MFTKAERLIALQYLKSQRRESYVSLTAGFSFIGIMLGVATLIIVLSVMNGFREDLLGRILGFSGHLTVYPKQSEGITDYAALTDTIRKNPKVTSATPMIEGFAMMTVRGKADGLKISAIRPEDLAKRELITDNMVLGTLEKFAEAEDSVLIGKGLSDRFFLLPGDKITLIAPEGNATAFGTMPRMRSFVVAGVFNAGMSAFDSKSVFITLEAGQKFFRQMSAVGEIEVFTSAPDDVKKISMDLMTHSIDPQKYLIYDWQDKNLKFFDAVKVERNVMFIILSLIILIAAFNIITTLVIMIKNKTKDIAILKTLGATESTIYRIFLIMGMLISFGGILLGCTLGLIFCWNIESIRQGLQTLLGMEIFSQEVYFLATMPAKVDIVEVLEVIGFSLTVSLIFSYFPARRASKLNPVEGLRHE